MFEDFTIYTIGLTTGIVADVTAQARILLMGVVLFVVGAALAGLLVGMSLRPRYSRGRR